MERPFTHFKNNQPTDIGYHCNCPLICQDGQVPGEMPAWSHSFHGTLMQLYSIHVSMCLWLCVCLSVNTVWWQCILLLLFVPHEWTQILQISLTREAQPGRSQFVGQRSEFTEAWSFERGQIKPLTLWDQCSVHRQPKWLFLFSPLLV